MMSIEILVFTFIICTVMTYFAVEFAVKQHKERGRRLRRIEKEMLVLFPFGTYKKFLHPESRRVYWIEKINKRAKKYGSDNRLDPYRCDFTLKELKRIHADGKIYTKTINQLTKKQTHQKTPGLQS